MTKQGRQPTSRSQTDAAKRRRADTDDEQALVDAQGADKTAAEGDLPSAAAPQEGEPEGGETNQEAVLAWGAGTIVAFAGLAGFGGATAPATGRHERARLPNPSTEGIRGATVDHRPAAEVVIPDHIAEAATKTPVTEPTKEVESTGERRELPEVALPSITLGLQRDTGISASDRYTNDATIVLSGIDPTAHAWEFRINGGGWQTGSGVTIDDSLFPGDGQRDVEVRHRGNGTSAASSVALDFEVDRTPIHLGPLLVPGAFPDRVDEDGREALDGPYVETPHRLVTLPTPDEVATWQVRRYDVAEKSWSETLEGSGDHVPESLFVHGPQVFSVLVTDRAGNEDEQPRDISVWYYVNPFPGLIPN